MNLSGTVSDRPPRVPALTALLLLTLFSATWATGFAADRGTRPTLLPRSPILIFSNAGFTAANGVIGGSGTFTDPYVIAGWDIDATLKHGIDIQYTTAHFTIRDVYVHSTPSTLNFTGIRMDAVENARVENVTLEDTLYGIWGQSVTNLTIARSVVSRTGNDGVYLTGATNLTIRDNVIQDSGVLNTIPGTFQWNGITLNTTRIVTISGNTLVGNDHFGLNADDIRDLTVTDNVLDANWGGTSVWVGFDVRLARNAVTNQAGYGFDFLGAHNVTVEDDSATNTLIGVLFNGILGDPLLQNEDVTIRRNVFSGNWEGMLLDSMVAPQVHDNVMRGSLNPAMTVELTAGGLFTGNVVEATQWNGVWLYQANRTTWLRNDFAGAVNFGFHALDSHDNTFVENRVAGNGIGVALEGSTGWLLHHNLFEGNALQAQDDLGAANVWDDGYPSGGNWWSDYGGVDMCSGPLQNVCPNPDSIGDTPYVIDADSRDRYPLWTPAPIPPSASFTATPAVGNITTVFAFDANASWDANEPAVNLLVEWDWEDDGTWDTAPVTNKNATHAYAAPGMYTVRLRVRDSTALTNETTRQVVVENLAPTAAFTVTPGSGDVTTSFTADASNSTDLEDPLAVLEVRWDWEDDGAWDTPWSVTKTATHTFPAVGAFTTRLQVRDSGGLVDEATRSVSLNNTAPTADLQASPAAGGLVTAFSFNASASADLEDPAALEVRWDWEDDAVWDTGWSAGLTANHAYGVAGGFVARVEVRDTGGLADTATTTVEVFPAPITVLQIGSPNVTLADPYVTSSTPLALAVTDLGGGVVRTEYRIDGGTWLDFAVSGPFSLLMDGLHLLEWRSEDAVGNVEETRAMSLVVDDSPPVLVLGGGTPVYTAGDTWVTSSTPITIDSQDSGNPAVGLATVEYRTWLGTWSPWIFGPAAFSLSGEGLHYIEYSALDLLGNLAVGNTSLVVDDTPPTTLLAVGAPNVVAGSTFVTSATPLSLSSTDGGATPVGLAGIEFHVDAGSWQPYTLPFTMAGEGTHTVGFRGTDLLGNLEAERSLSFTVDDTPPVTTLAPTAGTFNESTSFTLTATDSGSGVAVIQWRVNGSAWANYTGAFRLPGGNHTVRFRSVDELGNAEAEVSMAVTVSAPGIPPEVWPDFNYKPIVAAVFAMILLAVGYWLLVRRRERTDSRRWREFLRIAVPFGAVEATTGVLSAVTGLLAIPPLLGLGTLVDVTILGLGLAAIGLRARRLAMSSPEAAQPAPVE